MANKKPAPLEFEKYQHGASAARLLASEDSARYAPSALEVLAGKKGLNLGEEALGFVRGTQASEEGVKTAINVYAGKFEEKRGKYSPAQLVNWYNPILGDLGADSRDKIANYLGKYTESLQDIRNNVNDALNTLDKKAKKGKFTQTQINLAQDILKKYQEVLNVLGILDNYKFETLRPDAVDAARKQDLENLASRL